MNKKELKTKKSKAMSELNSAFVFLMSEETKNTKEEEYKIYVRMNSDAIKKFNSASELPNSVLENFSFIFCEDEEIMAEVQQRISNYFF